MPGGARKEAWFIDVAGVDGDDAVRPLFLRYDRSDPALTKDPWTLHREATVYLALQDGPVPVPRVLGVHPVHQAMLSERVRGRDLVLPDRRPGRAGGDGAGLHDEAGGAARARRDGARPPRLPSVTTVAEAVVAELDEWEGVLAARGGTPDPALVFSLRWLRDHIPAYDGPPVLVQGDTGPGNFMYLRGRVTAVVDWELAHLGDPMDDIAWLSLRATQEPFTDFPTRLREYEALSGNVVDETRVRYYQVMAETKLQVMGHRGPGDGRDNDDDGDENGRGDEVAVATSGTGSSTRCSIGGCGSRRWPRPTGWSWRRPSPSRPGSPVTATGCTTPSLPSCATSSCRGRRIRWRRHEGRGSPASSSTWPGSTLTAPTTKSASCRTWRSCSVGDPIRCEPAGRTPPRRWRRETRPRRTTS